MAIMNESAYKKNVRDWIEKENSKLDVKPRKKLEVKVE
jgi:hypothetical protein